MNLLFSPIKLSKQNQIQFDSPKSQTSTCCLSESDHQDPQKLFHFETHQKITWNHNDSQSKSKNIKLKNELCKNFLRMGYCPYNDKCQFAHGTIQLRQKTDHNMRYKTKKCNSFFNTGHCVYGERCNFLHKCEAEMSLQKWKNIKKNYRQLLQEIKPVSRFFPTTQQY